MKRLDGKVAIITGAARGVGLTAVKMLLAEGAKVVATSRRMENLAANLADYKDCEDLLLVQLDVSKEEDWDNAVKQALDKFGKIDVLVNNAGLIYGKSIEQETLEEWNRVLSVSATGSFLGTKKCAAVMGPGSSVVNISSVAGLRGGARTGNDAAYNAAKGAERLLTKHAAQALAYKGIRVNSIHPGAIMTDMLQEHLKAYPDALEANKVFSPLPPHYATPEQIVYGIIFLASDESAAITGIEMPIDNGMASF